MWSKLNKFEQVWSPGPVRWGRAWDPQEGPPRGQTDMTESTTLAGGNKNILLNKTNLIGKLNFIKPIETQ